MTGVKLNENILGNGGRQRGMGRRFED